MHIRVARISLKTMMKLVALTTLLAVMLVLLYTTFKYVLELSENPYFQFFIITTYILIVAGIAALLFKVAWKFRTI